MPAAVMSGVRRKVEIGGGTLAAISAILGSLIEPTPDGMAATRPSASAPAAMARKASSTDPMQQTLIRSLTAMSDPVSADGIVTFRTSAWIEVKPASAHFRWQPPMSLLGQTRTLGRV